ncbi:MAG: glycosyltransferase [Actinomycetota bacterium]|jgi:glycosyltransferase involved in cell wall biosynthesis|nr:glycosyltransferase [Actinomycetota bacterium]
MKVLIVGSAQSIAFEQWVTEVVARGHVVRILSPNTPRPAIAHLCETTESGPRLPVLRFIMRIRRIRRTIREFKPDVVHAHGAGDYGFWVALARFSPTLVTAWGSDVLVGPQLSRLMRIKVRTALRAADYLTATSATLLCAARSVAHSRVPGEVLSWGVDTRMFRPAESIDDGPIVFLSVRSLEPLYNIEVIVRAFARVRQEMPDARLILVGRGSEQQRIEGLVSELGIESSVDVRGWVEQTELPRVYRAAHVYVSVPGSDASAVSNMEAMASGLGIVASDLPSTREWIRHDSEGLLVPAGSVRELYEAMMTMRDSGTRKRLGGAARERIERIGDRKLMMDRASEIYVALAKGELP